MSLHREFDTKAVYKVKGGVKRDRQKQGSYPIRNVHLKSQAGVK